MASHSHGGERPARVVRHGVGGRRRQRTISGEAVWVSWERSLHSSPLCQVTNITGADPGRQDGTPRAYDTLVAGPQRPRFPVDKFRAAIQDRYYDITPDDQRFVMVCCSSYSGELVVVENFVEELERSPGN